MRVVTALDARKCFGQLTEMAQKSPIMITRHGRPSVVVISAAEYERRRMNAAKRLLASMARMAQEAAEKGITEEDREALLRNEN